MKHNFLLGYVFFFLMGMGCIGFLLVGLVHEPGIVVTATGTATLLLLAFYLTVVFVRVRKKIQEAAPCKSSALPVVFSVVTIIMALSFFMFHDTISVFFTEHPLPLKLILSIFFWILMIIITLFLFRRRK